MKTKIFAAIALCGILTYANAAISDRFNTRPDLDQPQLAPEITKPDVKTQGFWYAQGDYLSPVYKGHKIGLKGAGLGARCYLSELTSLDFSLHGMSNFCQKLGYLKADCLFYLKDTSSKARPYVGLGLLGGIVKTTFLITEYFENKTPRHTQQSIIEHIGNFESLIGFEIRNDKGGAQFVQLAYIPRNHLQLGIGFGF